MQVSLGSQAPDCARRSLTPHWSILRQLRSSVASDSGVPTAKGGAGVIGLSARAQKVPSCARLYVAATFIGTYFPEYNCPYFHQLVAVAIGCGMWELPRADSGKAIVQPNG